MATQTEHYQLSLREGTDIFNPLSTNDNFTKIDELIYNAGAGGMISATPAVSGNTMSFTNVTMVAGETVVKFVLSTDQQVNKFSFGGSTINVVDLSGAQVTVGKGLWIGHVDTNNTFKVLAWPMSVDADTLDGKEPDYYATATAVEAAASAASTANEAAQAATTVANQALAAASGAGMELLWTNPTPNSLSSGAGFTLSSPASGYKCLAVAIAPLIVGGKSTRGVIYAYGTPESYPGTLNVSCTLGKKDDDSASFFIIARDLNFTSSAAGTFGNGVSLSVLGGSSTTAATTCVIRHIYGVK